VASELARRAAASLTAIYTVSDTAPLFAATTGGAVGMDLDRVASETASYYVLALTADGGPFQVRVTRPGVTLRFRASGAPPTAPPPPLLGPLDDGMGDVLNSPFHGVDIGVKITPIFNNTAAEGGFVDVLCHIEMRNLASLRDEQGRYHLEFSVGVDSVPEGGRSSRAIVRVQELDLSAEEYDRAVREGLLLKMRQAWGVGPRDVRFAVQDHRSGSAGGASAFVQAYNLAAGSFFLSGIAIQSGNTVRQSPAVRNFHPGDTLVFVYNVFNASAGTDGRLRVQSQAQLVASGRQINAGEATVLEFGDKHEPLRIQLTGRIHLDPSIGHGHYILRITVTDIAAQPPRTAVQAVDFTVEP
jgi:hypothetical protein